jgi:hypothetical protein
MLGINEVVGSIRRGELPPLREKTGLSGLFILKD